MRIDLPWPDKRLNPNARQHWSALAKAKAKARVDAAYAVFEAAGASLSAVRASLVGEGPIALTVRFYPPDKRRRDDDNMVASFKAARDGIADALEVDDRRFRAHYFFEDAAKPGRVEVALRWGTIGDKFSPQESLDTLEKSGRDECANTKSRPDQLRIGAAK